MDWERIKPWEYLIANVAREYSRKYDMVDIQDIKQSLYEWFLTHPNKLSVWEAIGPKDAKNLIYRSLRNQALDYCQLWKAKSGGYEVDDLFYYTPEMVETLLPSAILGIDSDVVPKLSLGKTSRPSVSAESGNLITMLAEISRGYKFVSEEDRAVLHLRFVLSYDYPDIAKLMELNTDDAARQRVRRAVKRLINKIGGYKPFRDEDEVSSDEGSSASEEPQD